MNPFEYDGTRWRLADAGIELTMDAPAPGLFSLTPFPDLTIAALEAVVGDYPESLALAELRRPHHSEDGTEASFESASKIPFGIPTRIARKFRVDATSLSVQTSFEMPHAFQLETLSAGGLRFSGKIRRIGLVKTPNQEGAPGKAKWIDFESLRKEDACDASLPLLVLIVETDSGNAVRFELGKDVWRWMNAARLGGKSSFSVVREKDDLVFRWNLFGFLKTEEQPEPPHGRNWNLAWSLHWGTPEIPSRIHAALELDAMEEDGSGAFCAASAASLNAMKKWLRRQLQETSEGDVCAVRFRTPRFCMKGAHLDRARMGRLAHWDLPAVREFVRWGNRQLKKQGASLILILEEQA